MTRASRRSWTQLVWWRWGLVLALLVSLLGGLLAQPQVARAAELIVTNLDDDGPGSLRVRITEANSDADADVITFQGAGAAGVITLTTGQLPTITQPLTITGPGEGTLSVSGGGNFRVFQVASNVIVAISNLTITNGDALSGNAGGGINNAGTLRLTDVTVSNSEADTGGGIFNTGALTLTRVTISGNEASNVGNNATTATAGNGGGIANVGGTVTATGGTISGNTARNSGTHQGASFFRVSGSGGGIFNYFSDTASDVGQRSAATLTLTGTTISGNTATNTNATALFTGNGGGIASFGYVAQPASPYTSSNPAPNTATVTLTNVTVRENIALAAANANYSGNGGGLASINGTVTVTGGAFSTNTASGASIPMFNQPNEDSSGDGGAIASLRTFSNSSPAVVTAQQGTSFTGNTATTMGGAIVNGDAALTLNGVTLSGNSANPNGPGSPNAGSGGAIANIDEATATLTNVTINGTNSASLRGGGIFTTGTLMVAGSTVSGNTANTAGGGLAMAGSRNVMLTDSTVSGNSTTPGTGGGIAHVGTGDLMILRSTLSGNSAANGGGLYNAVNADTTIINSTLSGNSATVSGGGIYNADAAGVFAVEVYASTIANNSAGVSGGGIFTDAAPGSTRLIVQGSILADNTPGNAAGTIASQGYNVVDDNSAGFTGTGDQVVADAGLAPLAVNAPGTTATHALLPGSPAIDTIPDSICVTAFAGAELPAEDQRRVTRPQGVRCDSGSFEVVASAIPTLTSLDPDEAVAGSGDLPLTLTGTGFAPGGYTTVTFGGTPLATTYVSPTQLTAVIPAALLTTPGNVPVTVTNAVPGGGTSNSLLFSIVAPAPSPSPSPVASVAPSSLAFGNQTVGTTGASQPVTLTNSGGAPLAINVITTSGDFAQTNTCPASLPAGASCTISVTFTPVVAGSRTGNLTIFTNAAGSPHNVTLSGTGVAPASPSPAPVTYTVTVSRVGAGTVSPGTGTYTAGSTATFTAQAAAGQVFLGWTLDGTYVGFASPLTFTVDGNRSLVAEFAARPTFSDVPASDPDHQAITFLAAAGIINPQGVNGSGRFEPGREVARAEVAAFVARVFGWDDEFHANFFPDKCDPQGQNCVDDELWNNVAALKDYGIVGGYEDPATCASAGTEAPCYLPRDPVKRVQVVSVVARAFISTDLRPAGYWDRLPAVPGQYANVPDEGTQRSDLATYRQNAGPIPGQASDSTFPDPEGPASRRFVIQVLYQAFAAQFGTDRVP